MKNWKKSTIAINGLKQGMVWVADAPQIAGEIINYRQLWVNGAKAVRAKNTAGNAMDRILSWDKETESCWISYKNKSIKFEPGMEMFLIQWWAITNWMRPSQLGHVPLQAGMYLLDAYKLKEPGTPNQTSLENQVWVGRPRAAVEVNYANNILFEGCCFEQISSTGLDFNKGTNHNTVQGNLFKDIGGNGISLGVFSEEAF